MSTIGGKKRENNGEFSKKVGLFAARVICVNPTEKEYKDILGMELKEDSKAAEYLGTSKEGNTTVRVDFWLENVKENEDHSNDKFKVSFFLEDKVRDNKDGTKTQYINNIGICAWAEDENSLPEWFSKREFREAYVGEEDLYEFMRGWLNKLDYRDGSTVMQIEWKKLMKGNVSDIKNEVGGEWCGEIGCLATVVVKEIDGEIKTFQGIYNRAFFPVYTFKHLRLVDYDNDVVLEALKSKPSKDLKPYERFVLKVHGEYGCKDFFKLKELAEYDPSENMVSSNTPLEEGSNSDY
jgi:hypothetical protein